MIIEGNLSKCPSHRLRQLNCTANAAIAKALLVALWAIAISPCSLAVPPQPIHPSPGAPNIVLILLDDVGFADTSVFGGPVDTSALERLAQRGLRYNNFHTAAMCSPTRAALLTGRNHHRVGFGFLAESSSTNPGYNALWRPSAASVAEVLRLNGYSTAALGKWHNTPSQEVSPAGPFDRWPTSLGFEFFYGFMGWGTSQWEPELYRNTTPVEAPVKPRQDYHFTSDITDEAIRWLQTHESLAPDKPYFLYFAPGATHGPHHVPQEWIDRYRGRFEQGWDRLREDTFARQKKRGIIPPDTQLTPRPKEIPAWRSLSLPQRQLLSHQMEIYAAFLAHTDHEVGRLIDAIQKSPQGDNTLILYIVGDNGPAGEGGLNGQMDRHANGQAPLEDQLRHWQELGGPLRDNLYSGGWAWAGATPFQWFKSVASHFGATRNPLIVSWPKVIREPGALRTQFTHVNDIAATLYEAVGIRMPAEVNGVAQQSLDGTSFAATFNDAYIASAHTTQYFEILGNRAIYQDGWVAAAQHSMPWIYNAKDFAHDRWELYHVAEDFSEARDLASRQPQKLAELKSLFDREARRNEVYPLGGSAAESVLPPREEFVFYPGLPRVPVKSLSTSFGASFRIIAETVIPSEGAEGVLFSYGNRWEGFVLYAKGSHLIYENHVANSRRETIVSNATLPEGRVVATFEFVAGQRAQEAWMPATGEGRLSINGRPVGNGQLTLKPSPLYYGSLGVGRAFGSSVSPNFEPPFAFTGALEKVTVQLQARPAVTGAAERDFRTR
jgi:arylsulfatase